MTGRVRIGDTVGLLMDRPETTKTYDGKLRHQYATAAATVAYVYGLAGRCAIDCEIVGGGRLFRVPYAPLGPHAEAPTWHELEGGKGSKG